MQSANILLCTARSPPNVNFSPLKSSLNNFNCINPVLLPQRRRQIVLGISANDQKKRHTLHRSTRREHISITPSAKRGNGSSAPEFNDNVRKLQQAILWIAEGVYIIWLFLLPYAPGDPVWAISSETINSLIGLSLNFFFILPFLNSVGVHLIEAPDLHPMSEGLFNFVIGWTFMFAPLLYTDKTRHRYKGSLDVLWGFQMFLTNTFLIPYMAIRLNEPDNEYTPRKTSQLGSIMTKGAPVVGLIGGLACLLSILWALYGRGESNYGNLPER